MASLPLFFNDSLLDRGTEVPLNEDTARHIVQVLRMQVGEKLQLTNGRGVVADATIIFEAKKKCNVSIDNVATHIRPPHQLHLAIAFTKNSSRNEWLLEKATELGVSSITPLNVIRTERERSKFERWNGILISAMLQSQQCFLPHLSEATALKDVLARYDKVQQKLIAHCIQTKDRKAIKELLQPGKETLILIGPEGDFTEDEVTLCEEKGFSAVSLAHQRLRTETAAMAVCAYFNTINHEAE